MNPMTLHQMTERIGQLMEDRLGARGMGLRAKLAHRGGALPRAIRKQAAYLAEIETRAGNPKLAQHLDPDQVSAAYDACLRYLKPLGVSRRRNATISGIVASVSFSVLMTAAGVVAVMVWRGYL
jgi:hypothetical protein